MSGSVLVTGGAGFIGSTLARRLLAEGYDVVVLDNVVSGAVSNVPDGCELIMGDVREASVLAALPKRDYVACCHLAAQSSGEVSFEDPRLDVTTNVIGTLNVLDWVLERGVGKVVFASSMGIYGDVPPDVPVAEDTLPHPKSFYSVSKLAVEHLLKLYETEYGLRFTAPRLFNVYGVGQDLDNLRQGMLSIYLRYLLDGERVLVKGSLDRYRDYVYVDDVVDVFVHAITAPELDGEIFNCGTGVQTHVSTLIEKLCACFGIDDYRSVVDQAPGTQGDQFGNFASVERMKELGVPVPATTLDEGLRRMVDWAKQVTLKR